MGIWFYPQPVPPPPPPTELELIWMNIAALARRINDNFAYISSVSTNRANDLTAAVATLRREITGATTEAHSFTDQRINWLSNLVSQNINLLRSFVDTEVTRIYNDITAITKEILLDTDKKLAQRDLDLANTVKAIYDYIDKLPVPAIDFTDLQMELMKSAIDNVVSEYSSTVDLLFSDLYADLQGEVSRIETSIASLASDAMTWIVEKVGQVWTWLNDTGNAIYTWINQKIADVTNYITNWIGQITEWLNAVIADFTIAFSRVYQKIADEINWVIDQVGSIVDAVKATLEAAIETVKRGLDWSNQFFNLTLAFPEIGILSALIRDDPDFDHYKPYWQAFLARLLT